MGNFEQIMNPTFSISSNSTVLLRDFNCNLRFLFMFFIKFSLIIVPFLVRFLTGAFPPFSPFSTGELCRRLGVVFDFSTISPVGGTPAHTTAGHTASASSADMTACAALASR